MKRLSLLFLAAALAGACILSAVGCTTNPVTSQVVVPADPIPPESMTEGEVAQGDTGGYPATTQTMIEKFESGQDVSVLSRTP